MNVSLLFTAAVVALTCTSFATGAAAKGHGDRASFAQLDADGSGEVTQAEMEAFRLARLTDIDTNGDGALSADELTAARDTNRAERMERRIGKMIERRDANGDGLLQFDELGPRGGAEKVAERFAAADTDGSGGLSEAEMDAAKEKRGKRGGRKGQGGSDNG